METGGGEGKEKLPPGAKDSEEAEEDDDEEEVRKIGVFRGFITFIRESSYGSSESSPSSESGCADPQ